MMSWPWGRRSMGKTRANRSGSSSQPPAISGVMAEVAQVSITSGAPAKPPGRPRSAGREPSGTSGGGGGGGRGEPRLGGDQWVVVVDLAVLADRVPEGERHPEEPLAADAPVGRQPVDPVLEAAAHPLGRPGKLAPPR